jgi:hypothetical protein
MHPDALTFRARIAPLLSPDSLRALRLVNRPWQCTVDQLVEVKGAFGLRRRDHRTIADIRYARAVGMRVDSDSAVLACAGGELEDLLWALTAFRPPRRSRSWRVNRLVARVSRIACLDLLLRSQDFGVDAVEALRGSCAGGQLAAAEWLARTFRLTAVDARSGDNHALRLSCANGHLAVAQWLSLTFQLTPDDARSLSNHALRFSCENGHLAVAQWLVGTFRLTADDASASNSHALRYSCQNGHLAVARWLCKTFGCAAEGAACQVGPVRV